MAPTKTISKTQASASSIIKLPLDTRNDPTLRRLNQLLYIPETGIWVPGKKSTPIFDYSSHFDRSAINWFTDDYVGFNEDVMAQTKELAHTAIAMDQNSSEDILNPAVIFKLSRTHWYNDSKFIVTKPAPYIGQRRGRTLTDDSAPSQDSGEIYQDEVVLAEYVSPLLAYGVTNISFPDDSLHSSHPITVRPINATRRSQSFVQDSVSYVWDVNRTLFPGGGGVLSLYKGIGANKKIEIGRYQSDNGQFVPGGLVVIDSDEVDVLIAVLSLMSVLAQRESFSVPTGNWAGMIVQ
ncbi:hypothetical protein UA08_07429 [Talaromyces atroroseus]|uniref:Uncharacterized protein n=1 Tax=Talaromyces atroroseus TaxID=1441469 RepID=A0A225AE98_TALAT|nr:hypothetical protein UA08_07429 [Talaromyces atroroseus]OKL57363.1 hypothetical protein UA08_07429 [Talaromyces atroroseus]